MKKWSMIIFVFVLISLTGCSCEHKWIEANCQTAKICELCGISEGEPKEHKWEKATCENASLCKQCGTTQGNALGHSWTKATCTKASVCKRCKKTQGEELGHNWQDATYELPKTCTRCGLTDGDPKNIFKENDIPSLGEYYYHNYFFVDYFDPEEYIAIYKMAREISATPSVAINESLFVVHQHFATYNTTEDKYMLMDIHGNIVRYYGDNSCPTHSNRLMKAGKYTFVPISNDPTTFEIIDEKGNLISRYVPTGYSDYYIEYVCAIGSDYHIFAVYKNGGFVLHLLSPTGETCAIGWPSSKKPYTMFEFQKQMGSKNVVIGDMSEDMFYIWYKRTSYTNAFYFNTSGKVVIDLSDDKTNFHVYKMGNFVKGTAEIYLRGVDGCFYTAIIDATGKIVGEPAKDE